MTEVTTLATLSDDEKKLKEALDYLKGTVASTDITKVDRLKVAVCGPGKTGKSNLIAKTCRKPLLVYDFDDRRESIAGAKETTIKTLVDIDHANPTAWGKFETDIGTLEWLKSEKKLPFQSIALDSMTFMRIYAENQMMKDTKNERVYQINGKKYHLAQGWDAVTAVQKMLYESIRRLFALDIDVYCTFHTTAEKDKAKSTKENVVYTDKITVDPNNLVILLPMFNEVWRTFVDSNQNFKVQVKPDYYFSASTALTLEGTEQDQNITKMIEMHNSK